MSHRFVVAVSMAVRNSPYWDGLCSRHNFSMVANFYDAAHGALACPRARTAHVRGTKALFWFRELSALPAHCDFVWLLDEDVRYTSEAFGAEAARMDLSRAVILQPSVIPRNHGKFATHEHDPECAVHTISFVEVQAPLFAARAWHAFHSTILSHTAADVMQKTDWFDLFWCNLVERKLNASCAFSRDSRVEHLDFKTLKHNRTHRMPFHLLSRDVRSYLRYPGAIEPLSRCLLAPGVSAR